MIGANDVTHRIDKSGRRAPPGQAVRSLRDVGAEVVVGTCPDLGTIEPVPQPLRLLARRWSRDLAAAQTVAVVEAGGRTVSLGDLLGPEFDERPHEMFSADRFHPSPAGYARAAAALLPSVCAALGVWVRRAARPRPTAVAARASARSPSQPCRPCATPAPRSAPTAVGGPGAWSARALGHAAAPAPHEPVADRGRAGATAPTPSADADGGGRRRPRRPPA